MIARTAKPDRRKGDKQTLSIEVDEDEPSWTCLSPHAPPALAGEVARAVAATLELPAANATACLALSSDAEVRTLNGQWRGKDKATNVLSFPALSLAASPGSDTVAIGDIIIAEETLVSEAADAGIPVADHFRHLVLHGLLHLLGYDHETDAEAEEMEALETQILAELGVPDPYAGSEPVTVELANSQGRKQRPSP